MASPPSTLSPHGASAPPAAPDVAAARNLVEMFELQAALQGKGTAVLHKRGGRWREVSWEEMARRARDVADGLASLGVAPGDRVSIVGETQIEWVLADLGIMGAGAVTVPIYQSSLPEECRSILDDAQVTWIFVDSEAQAAKIRAIRPALPRLAGVVRLDGEARGDGERTLAALEEAGAEWRRAHPGAHAARLAAVGAGDPASIHYTSGTTGRARGVVLTHGNWMYEARAVAELRHVRAGDVVLSFLPMAHSYAKMLEAAWFAVATVAAYVESLDKIVENAAEVRPTMMPSVPRIFDKTYAAVVAQGLAAPGLRGKLFRLAMKGFDDWVGGKLAGEERASLAFRLGRWLVFPKVARALSQRFGGRMRLFGSGGAPLSPRVAWFFQLLGFTILEGWGLTETSAATCVNPIGRSKIGTVGPPVPGTEIRIAEDGEILVRGPGVMRGYHNDPAATAEVLRDGWLATGDIGELDADGYLRITDRKKDLIKTSGGKYVAPQPLEAELRADPLVSQAMVHGDGRKFVTALLTLDPANARRWAAENGVAPEALHEHPALRARLQRTVDAVNARLPRYATIKAFAVLPRDLTVEAGELTPTLKVKRRFCGEKYRAVLDGFYVE